MYVTGPLSLRILFHFFVVFVGVLILSSYQANPLHP
jgi:hypothetical protein